jgi:hypothetical protein
VTVRVILIETQTHTLPKGVGDEGLISGFEMKSCTHSPNLLIYPDFKLSDDLPIKGVGEGLRYLDLHPSHRMTHPHTLISELSDRDNHR